MKSQGNISYKMKIDKFIEIVVHIKNYLRNNDVIIINNRFFITKSPSNLGFPKFYLIDNALTNINYYNLLLLTNKNLLQLNSMD